MNLPNRHHQRGISQALVLGALAAAAIAAWLLWPNPKAPPQITPQPAPPAIAATPETPPLPRPASEAPQAGPGTTNARTSSTQIHMRP